jgi:polyisoprenoid-binding protein YceI
MLKAVFTLALWATLPVAATSDVSTAVPAIVAEGSALALEGDSSLHRYSAKADEVDISVGLDVARVAAASAPLDLETLIRGHFVAAFRLTVAVDHLHSGRKGLDANLRKALRGDQFREIRFVMVSYDVAPSSGAAAALAVVVHGRLSLAGVERAIDVGATGVRVAGGFRFSGSKTLSMKDFRVEPPTLMLGAIKTSDAVTVKLAVTLRRQGPR